MNAVASKNVLCLYCESTEQSLTDIRSSCAQTFRACDTRDPYLGWAIVHSGRPDPYLDESRFLQAMKAWGFHFSSVMEAMSHPDIRDCWEEYFDECESYGPNAQVALSLNWVVELGTSEETIDFWISRANNFRGFCIVLDRTQFEGVDREETLFDIRYCSSPPSIDTFIHGIALDQAWCHCGSNDEEFGKACDEAQKIISDFWIGLLATKPMSFEAQKECRLVWNGPTEGEIRKWHYPPTTVIRIIAGNKMDPIYRQRLALIANDLFPKIRIETATKLPHEYSVSIN